MQHKIYKKVVLVILDGFGVASKSRGNAISLTQTPTLNDAVANYPSLTLQASGPLVGLPWGEMGNSEVGHLNIGAGRIVGQDLPRISNAIADREFFKNPELLAAVKHALINNSSLHLIGMVSPGGVHSLDEHLYALLAMAAENNLSKVYVHMFTDGRDTEPQIALESIRRLYQKINEIGVGRIATVSGRFYAMDRGGHWDQTALAYEALVEGKGESYQSPESCVESNYRSQIFDEMIKPSVIADRDRYPICRVADNDSAVFFNFRPDRGLQLVQMFTNSRDVPIKFQKRPLQNVYFVTMTDYGYDLPVHAAFPQTSLKNNLAEVLSRGNFTQYHIAESEKYAHVTVFFNCGHSDKFPGEEREIIASPDNKLDYVDHPEMSAEELTRKLCGKIIKSDTNFFVANYANADMVGHTGSLNAGMRAVECLERCFKDVINAALVADAALIITSDHGNIEQMINPKTGDIDKDHTTNPVPFLLIGNEFKFKKPLNLKFVSLASEVPSGAICDIAPTILNLFGLPRPPEMTGVSLLDIL